MIKTRKSQCSAAEWAQLTELRKKRDKKRDTPTTEATKLLSMKWTPNESRLTLECQRDTSVGIPVRTGFALYRNTG